MTPISRSQLSSAAPLMLSDGVTRSAQRRSPAAAWAAVVGSLGEPGAVAADRRQHVEAAVGVDLDQAAAGQGGGELGRLGAGDAGDVGEDVEADRVVHDGEPAEAPLLVLVQQRVGRADGLVDGGCRRHVGHPDQRDLHPEVLDEQRQAATGLQQAPHVSLLPAEVHRVAAGRRDPREEELDGRALEGLPAPGHRAGARGAPPARAAGPRPWPPCRAAGTTSSTR